MAAGQQRKRLARSNLHELQGKKKKRLESSNFILTLRSHVHLQWDDGQKRVVAKKEQIGITWKDMSPYVDSVPDFHSGLADVFSFPKEVFDLDNLLEVISHKVWLTCLSSSEKKLLMQFLPSCAFVEQAVPSLLTGENLHFGNPFLKCDGDSQPNSYHEALGTTTFGDLSSSSTSTHACPYLALHHAMNIAHSSGSISVPEKSPFYWNPANLAVQSSVETLNPHNFSAVEAQNSNWSQQSAPPSISLVGNSYHSMSSHNVRFSRNDVSNQHRLGSFVHALPLSNWSIPARNGSNLVAASMAPPFMGEVRAHVRNHDQSVSSSSSSSSRGSAFPPARRQRPMGVALISSSSSTDLGGLYGFSVSNSTSRSHQDSDRHFDRFYGWGRESFTPLSWIPLEGESQWWGPFNPNQPPQPESFL